MLVFINNEKDTYFIVRNSLGKITHLPERKHETIVEFADLTGGLEYLTLPDLKAVNQFRKLINKDILKNIPLNETRKYLIDEFPEYFI